MSALKFVGKHMKRHKGKIIISLVLSIVISLVSSLGPYIMKLIVDVGIPEGRIEYILILSSMAVAVYFLYSMGNFLLSYIFTLLSETVNLDIKKEIYNKLMYYPLSFFGNKEKGYILARTNEINSIKPLFSSTTCKLGLSIIEFVIASVFLFSINTSFTICIYLFLPIYFLLIKMMMNKTRYIVGKNMEEVATANGTIQQVLSGIEQVKISNKEKTESQKINNLNERISKLSTKQSVLLNLTSESIMLICNIISVLVLVISAIHISKNNMTMGDYFAFSGYLPKLLAPVQALASSLISIQPAIASLKRLVQYFSEKIEVENDLPYLNISNGQIVFENIEKRLWRVPVIKKEIILKGTTKEIFKRMSEYSFIQEMNSSANVCTKIIFKKPRIIRYGIEVKNVGYWESERVFIPEKNVIITQRKEPMGPFKYLVVIYVLEKDNQGTKFTYIEEFDVCDNYQNEVEKIYSDISKKVNPILQKITDYFNSEHILQ